MPISPETRRITDREWEDRRLRIYELYVTLGRRLDGHDGVIETMTKEGFTATVPQYEHRFRKWRIRKNIKRAEWERIINEARQGGEITHIDRTISRSQIQRARRRCTSRVHRGEESVSRNYDDTTRVEVTRHIPELEFQRSIPSTEIDVTTTTIAVDAEINGVASWQDMQDFNTINYDVDMTDLLNFNDPFSVELFTSDPLQMNLLDRHNWLPPLPSTQLVATFIKGVYSKWLTTPLPGALTKTSDSNFLWKFMNTVTQTVSTSRSSKRPPILDNLCSLEVFAGEEWSQFDRLPDDVALQARFDGRLIASIINGFEGLENIPAKGVLKFLNRHHAMQLMVIDVLSSQSSPVVKSFAEKLFMVYLKTDNAEAIKYLLSTRLADANDAVCHYQGERYAPLEIAAINQSFEVLKFLISKGVDVNKSFQRDYNSNALHLLIRHLDDHRMTLGDDFLSLVDAFLGAGAAILINTIMDALELVDPRLIFLLIKNAASQIPQKLISHEYLFTYIIRRLEKQHATSIIEFILNNCQQSDRSGYLYKFRLHVDDALNEAARRGYEELVGILFPYASIPSRDKSFQTAVETARYPKLIELMLQKDPSLDKDHGLDSNTKDCESFISALRSRDKNRLRSLEKNGVLNHLQGYRLGQALTEALKAGNLEYATKILDLDPDFGFYKLEIAELDNDQIFDVAAAMDAALAHDLSDIAWKLLAVGITTRILLRQDLCHAPLLYVAAVRNRPDFVRKIIESGYNPDIFHPKSDDKFPILEAAIKHGEDSVFDDIWKACPRPVYLSRTLLGLALEKRGMDLVLDIIKSGPQEKNDWKTEALEVAVEYENEFLLDELISLGADADNDFILQEAICDNSSMVMPLLDRFWKAHPQGRAGYGWDIVLDAIEEYSVSPKLFDQVFAWDLLRMNVNYKLYPDQKTLLMEAIKTHDYGVVKKLIDAGSNINIIAREGGGPAQSGHGYVRTTPFLDAIKTGIIGIVQLLVDHGAEVNKPAMYGIRRTPLQKAAEMNNLPIVRLLLSIGAEVNASPAIFDGATALQFAAIQGNCEIATTLIEHGADYNIPPPFGRRGRWPLEGAAENGRFDMIELLWNAFQGSFDDKQYQNAMRLAEKNGHLGCKEKIKELMARSSTRDNIYTMSEPITADQENNGQSHLTTTEYQGFPSTSSHLQISTTSWL